MYLHVMRSSAHVTFCAIFINYLNFSRSISSLVPVVVFFYVCVFFEVFAFLILEFVHDVDFSDLDEDITLKTLLGKIKGRKSIYTNATFKHAKNILKSTLLYDEIERNTQ